MLGVQKFSIVIVKFSVNYNSNRKFQNVQFLIKNLAQIEIFGIVCTQDFLTVRILPNVL